MISHVPACLEKLALAVDAALNTMGHEAVTAVRAQMAGGYPEAIRETGALMADVQFARTDSTAVIGSTLPYAPLVHDGTRRMAGRPYLTDGILGRAEDIFSAGGREIAGHFP